MMGFRCILLYIMSDFRRFNASFYTYHDLWVEFLLSSNEETLAKVILAMYARLYILSRVVYHSVSRFALKVVERIIGSNYQIIINFFFNYMEPISLFPSVSQPSSKS